MLVLAVLVAVGAMVLPALHGPLEDQRLLKSADLIRAQWTKARVTAMKNGRMYVFRYVTATDQYAIEPWSGEVDATEASQEALTGQTLPLPQATTEKRHMLGVAGQRLPDGVQFFWAKRRQTIGSPRRRRTRPPRRQRTRCRPSCSIPTARRRTLVWC